MSKYYFNKDVAKRYGVNEAIVLEMLYFRLSKTNHIYDGKKWWFGSIKHIQKSFPFYTEKQVWRIMNSLEKQKAVIVGNYNKMKYDRTKWYTMTEEAISQMVKPIPVVINNNNKEFELPKHKPL